VLATSVGACPAKRDINTAPNAVRTRISKETVYLIFKAPWQRRGPAPDSELSDIGSVPISGTERVAELSAEPHSRFGKQLLNTWLCPLA
jgi:hypothetical protein